LTLLLPCQSDQPSDHRPGGSPRPVGHGEHRGAVRVHRGRMHIEECTRNGSRAPAYLWSWA